MVGILTSPPVPMVKGRVRHCGRVKHCIKTIDLYIYLFTVLRQQRSELVNDHPVGQGIVGRRSVDLLAMPLDPTKFFMKHLRVIPESLPPVVPVVLGVMPPRRWHHPRLHPPILLSHLVGFDVSSRLPCWPHRPNGSGRFLPRHLERSLLQFDRWGFTWPNHEDLSATVGVGFW
jgi:hypothetical protein